MLVPLWPTERREAKGAVSWRCRCDCGNEADFTECQLVHGDVQSCGCLKRRVQAELPEHRKLHFVDGTCVEYLEKRKHRKDNTSGFDGIHLTPAGTYEVRIGFKGKSFYIGTYRDFGEAVQARLKAEQLIHGGFLEAYRTWRKKAALNPAWAEVNPPLFNIVKDGDAFAIRQSTEKSASHFSKPTTMIIK